MGGLFGGLVGAGNVGEQMAQGKEISRQRQMSDEEFQQKRQEFQQKMAQMQQVLAGLKQQQSAIQWDQTPLTNPKGQIVYRGVDPTGKIVYSDPQNLSPIPKAAALVPHRLTPNALGGQEAQAMGAVTYDGTPPDPNKKWYVDEIGGRNIAVPFGTPTSQDKPTKAFAPPGGGEPVGIVRNNKALMPGMSEWTEDDQKFLDAEKKSYNQGLATKTQNQMKVAQERYKMLLQIPVPVFRDDGSIGFATRQQIIKNPDKYAGATQGAGVMGAKVRFNEIRTTAQMVNMAINKLPDTGFDAESRAKIASVMGTEHPEGAWQNFVQSGLAKTLSDEQIDYVTALMSLKESANALSGLQGIGRGGTDLVRSSIQRMLPGPATPSRAYAQRQMQLFNVELDQLERGLPKLPGGLGGPGAQGQTGMIRARDPQGKLHEAPAGTPLPAGWKLENATK